MRFLLSIILLSVACGPSLALAAPPSIRPVPIDDEGYAEAFTAVSLLENETYILLQLLFTNAGFGSEKPACRALVIPKGKKAWNEGERGDRGDWKYDEARNSIRAMDCVFRSGAADTEFRVKLKGRTVILRSPEPLVRKFPKQKRIVLKDGMFEGEVMMPWAPVKATLSGPGIRGAEGVGKLFIDHTRSNAMMKDVASVWVRFRGFYGDKKILLQGRSMGSSQLRGWVWPEGEPRPVAVARGGISRKRVNNNQQITVHSMIAKGVITSRKLLFTYKPVEEYGVLGAMAKPFVGDPIVRTYLATWVDADGTEIRGVLETLDMDD